MTIDMINNVQSRPVIKYIGLFALTYIVFLFAISILVRIFGDDMTGIFYAIAILGAGRVTVYAFFKENSRLYTRKEKIKLIAGTFLSAFFIDAITFYSNMVSHGKSDYGIIVGAIFNLIILWYVFGYLSKSLMKR